jgi:hypothetical protein
MVEEELRQRRFEPVVRLEVQPDADSAMVAELVDRFGLGPDAVYEMSALLDYTTLFEIAGLDVAELRDRPWTPLAPRALEAAPDSDIFSAIRSADILLHHPYESFYASVERFIREAADDPQTLSIKMTVYRVGDDTPFVRSLIAAAEAGKQVACVIELNARFDEERNLHWSRELERVGAHVMFGVTGLKTHSKVALVVRNEDGVIRSYAHIGTGNYHTRTAKLYEDVGLLTADPVITGDVVSLFHYPDRALADAVVLGAAGRPAAHAGAVRRAARGRDREPRGRPAGPDRLQDEPARGPRDVRPAFPRLRRGSAGRPDRARALLPGAGRTGPDRERAHPVDHRALPRALADLPLRERLEDPLEGTFLIGSADWMTRNLSERVEAAVPITKPRLRRAAVGDPRDLPGRPAKRLGAAVRRQLHPAPARRIRGRRPGGDACHADAAGDRAKPRRRHRDRGRGRRRVSARYAHPVGVSMGDMVPPERIGEKARWLEGLGYSHIMIPEDYFYVPALVGATLALQATESVPVGTSIVSGLVRHPAVLAMEIAGISRAFPGRFRPGIGLGLPDWLRQMGIMPAKPVAALRESVTSVRRLLAGRRSASRASTSHSTRSASRTRPPSMCRSRWG